VVLPSNVSSASTAAGFFITGLLLSFPGAILPAWGYHVRPHYSTIGSYFLAINIGLLISVRIGVALGSDRGRSLFASLGCAVAAVGLVALSLTAPPVGEAWRWPGFITLGVGAGLVNTGVFRQISVAYRKNPAAAVNLAGTFFGLGALLPILLIAGTFHVYTVFSILIFLALIPAVAAVRFAQSRSSSELLPQTRKAIGWAATLRNPGALLLSLLLFVHFGNEWAIAGWLPLFLVQRLGLSPVTALLVLATFWTALVVCRLAAQLVLPLVRHSRILFASVLAALFGCLVLSFTDNLFGAVVGALFTGLGFAPIYPLVVERIGNRFPDYHPGLFNGIFSIALTGGMLAPATMGLAGEIWGIGVVMFLPAIGTGLVFLLVLMIWLEAKLSGTSELAS
jgi:fucose permease